MENIGYDQKRCRQVVRSRWKVGVNSGSSWYEDLENDVVPSLGQDGNALALAIKVILDKFEAAEKAGC